MSLKLPTFALVLLLAANSATAQSAATGQTAQGLPDGQQLLAQAARLLAQQRQLEASVRQKIDLFGQQLSGPGFYAQMGDGSGRLMLELKLAVGGQLASLQQVSDGRFLYVRRQLPQQKTLARIDLRRVRRAAQAAGRGPGSQPPGNWLLPGGLPNLLRQLHEHFQFGLARPAQMEEAGGGRVPVWIVSGTWKREKLAALMPERRDEILAGQMPEPEAWPEQLPQAVSVTLGRDDVFPLFPYRIVYLRRAAVDPITSGPDRQLWRPMLTLELFQVRRRTSMKPSEFDFVPNDEELVDQTDQYLESLGLAGQEPAHD